MRVTYAVSTTLLNLHPEPSYQLQYRVNRHTIALDVDLEEWWFQHKLLSPLKRFGKFIEEVLLVEVRENIVIFIDEIDSVLSLKFPTDDFFAFIRACYNQRADNHKYRRLSFCLLGVASPSELIADKKRTPFNIGQAIFLKGFQWEEVEPLKKGLQGKLENPTAVMKEILEWTGGQPFLTQKLCQVMIEESDREQPRSVEEIVRERIIANWESQDEPEHLKTITDRILRNERRAGRLLGLYQKVLVQGNIAFDSSEEQTELRLSGLVVKRDSYLQINNRIYGAVFDRLWLKKAFAKLRPYSESFTAWVNSGCTDESRLLRGDALKDAQDWASGKSLSDLDYQFLAAGQELDMREVQLALAAEKESAEILAKANETFIKAQEKAMRIRRRAFLTLVFSSVVGIGFLFNSWGTFKALGYYQRGQELTEAGYYEAAIAEYNKAIDIKSNFAIAWTNRGFAQGQLGRHLERFSSCAEATNIDPNFY